jgi:hypothetical protein
MGPTRKMISQNEVNLSHVDGMRKSDTQPTENRKSLHNKSTNLFAGKSNFSAIIVSLMFLLMANLGRVNAQTTVPFTTIGSNTWICPTGVTSVTVQCWGAGGGGGSNSNSMTKCGGGGGGAYSSSTISVTSGTTYYINVGAGAVATNGGNSWFNASTTSPYASVNSAPTGIATGILAEGGKGVTTVNTITGGAKGLASNSFGTTKWDGGTGGTGSTYSGSGGGGAGSTAAGGNGSGTSLTGGTGGSQNGGTGGAGRSTNGAGNVGTNYGAGGGGSYRQTSNASPLGAAGTQGYVTVTYTCPNQTLTYSQGFNAATIPSCWSQQNVSTPNMSFTFPSTGTGTPAPAQQEGTNQVMFNSYTNSGSQTRLVSAPITTTGTSSVDVQFQWYFSSNGGATSYLTEGVQVQYSTDGSTWINAGSLIRRYGATDGWALQTITLPAGAGNKSTIYVGFLFTSNAGYDSYLDAAVIKPTPTCFTPTAVSSSAVTATTATISWTAASPAPSNGYAYEVRTSGLAGSGATGLTTSGSTAAGIVSANISGLAASTTYYVYVKSDCGGSGYSDWTSAYSFTTLIAACTTPTAQPTNLNLTSLTSTGLSGSFTAASPAPSGYLVVRSTSNSLSGNPVDGTTYSAGNALGGGTVVQASATTSFTESSLSSNTKYYYFIFSYNNTSCSGGPKYFTTTPLQNNATTCPAIPTSPTTSSVTSGGFTVGWTAPTNGATDYTVDISLTNFGASISGFPQTTSSTSLAVSGLNASTTYYYKIKANNSSCSSAYTTVGNVTSSCAAISSLPWTENFDAMGSIGNSIIPTCWTATSGSGTPWASMNVSGNTYNDPSSTPNYITCNYNPSAADKYLITPGFSLTSGTSYDFSFKFAGDGYSGWTADARYNTSQTGTGSTILDAAFLGSGTTSSSTYQTITRTFIAPTTGTYYFMVHVNNTITPYYLGFDDFSLVLSPSCIAPTAVTSSAVTTTTATISWTAPVTPPSNGYQWEVRTSGTAGSGGATASGTTAAGVTAANVTGLTASTIYYVYVRSDCGSGSYSTWTSAYTFTTACSNQAYATIPYTQGFEPAWIDQCSDAVGTARIADQYWKSAISGTSPDNNDYWHRSDYTGSDWAYSTSGVYTPAGSVGSYSAKFHDYNAPAGSVGNLDLYVNLSSGGSLNFDYINPETGANSLTVMLSTDGGSTFPTTLATLSNGVSSWTAKGPYIISTTSSTCVIRFQALSNYGSKDMGIDNISVTAIPNPPTCTAPTSTPVSYCQNASAATLSVTATAGSGSISTYKWYRNGTASNTGGTLVATHTSSATTDTLTPATSATGDLYYYVVVTNSNTISVTGNVSGAVTVIALPTVAAIGGGATSVCAGLTTPAFTDATAGGTWSITAGTGTASITSGGVVTGLTAGAATVVYTYNNGTCSNTNTISITVNPLPTSVTASASSNTICPGSTIDLTSSATSNASSLVNFSEGFETFPPSGWTFINAGSGNSWASSSTYSHSGAKSISYDYTTSAANAWGITPGMTLTAGTTYIITFWYETYPISAYPEKLKVTVGGLPTVAGQSTTLWDCNGAATLTNQTWAQGSTVYTPTISGTYYFGFNCYSDANKEHLYVDDVSITGGSAIPATFSWASTPVGYTSSAQNPTGVSPTVNTQYTVTAQNSYGCTASNSTTVNIITLPQCATYTSPANGAPNAGLGSSLTWTAPGSGGTPTGYKLYFGTDNPPTNMINGTNIGNVLTYSPTLSSNTTYYWKVVPTNCAGDASCSDIWSFHTATPTIVTVGPSADFPTIRAAYDACTLASPYIIEVQPPYAGETYPILFGSANAGQRSANNIIIIRPASGASWNFTTGTVNSLFEFNGAKWVVIDGRKGGTGASGITMENTQTASGNWAISMHGGSTNNTIKYCTIKGSNADATATAANAGIIRIADGTNSNNTIDNCTITPSGSNKPAVGILSYDGTNNNLLTITNNSFIDITRYGIWASGNNNTGWAISNNKFYESGAIVPTPAGVMAAIQIDNGGGYTISGNNIGGQAGGSSPYTVTGNGTSGFVGINFANSTASSTNTITSNTINDITINLSVANTATPFCFTGINATGSANFTIGSSGNGNTIGDMTGTTHKITIASTQSITNGFSAINNTATGTTTVAYNNVGSIDLSGISTACSNNVNIIRNSNASGTITIDHNTIGNTVTDNMNMGVQAASLVYNQASIASATFAATNNTIQNIKYTGSGAFYGIYNNQCAMTCTGNNISGINSTGTSYQNCIYHSAAYTANISNNNINTITATNAGSQSKIIYLSSGTAASTISDNTIGTTSANNISLAGNTTQYAIDITNGGTITCDHNVIQNITLTSTGSNNIFFGLNVGPSSESKGTPGTAVLNATNNTIQDITTSSASNHYNESFAGLRLYSSGSGHTISNNVIQRLKGIGTGAGSCEINAVSIRGGSNGAFTKNIISDITVSHAYANMHAICYDEVSTFGGTWNFYNNAIILNNSTNGYVEGLHFYGTGVNNTGAFYHNTIKISGTTIANVSSVAFGFDVTQGTYTIENNVFQNLRTGGTSNYVIENLDSYAITEKNDYLQGSDPAKIGNYGGTDKTFAAWNTTTGSLGNINGNTTPVSLDAIGKPPVGAPLQNAGAFLLATVPDDRLSASRAIAPYPGAYELTATLPVELLGFRAVCKNTDVLITWSTATETNNDYFTIEYSTDAKNWQAIATVKGANNSNQILRYSTIHESINNGGISYYRLKQTNFDGEYEYFTPVVVSCNSENQYKINVYPNPFNQHLNIDINGLTTEKANILIMDLTGKTVFSQSLNNNDNTFKIDLDANLPNGVYFMKVQVDATTQTYKIVKCMN